MEFCEGGDLRMALNLDNNLHKVCAHAALPRAQIRVRTTARISVRTSSVMVRMQSGTRPLNLLTQGL